MSSYYKYEFTSPQPIYALIRQQFRAYFETGALTDLLFPIWTNKCLKKLGKGSYKIEEVILDVKNSVARLPDDFISVRELWLCISVTNSRQLPNAHYLQTATRLDNAEDIFTQRCTDCETPDIIRAIYKVTTQVAWEFKRKYLLRPGNLRVQNEFCGNECSNVGSDAPDIFDIRDNKVVTNFAEGTLHLVYYSKQTDDRGYQLVPDNFYIMEYIEDYIKYMLYDDLCKQSLGTDSYNALLREAEKQEAKMYQSLALVDIETKKKTVQQRMDAIKRTQHRLDKYIIR